MFTPAELAGKWGVCVETVLREIRKKKLQAFKIGREWRVPEAWANQYLLSNTSIAAGSANGQLLQGIAQ